MKRIVPYTIVCFLVVTLELFVFNFSYVQTFFVKDVTYNVVFTEEQLMFVDWDEHEGVYVSRADHMIILENVDQKVQRFTVDFNGSAPIPYVAVLYTDEENPAFNENALIYKTETVQEHFEIELKRYVKDLRIDLGDAAGLTLSRITLTLNPMKFDFSLSRIIAMILICVTVKILFLLQKIPSYCKQ